MGPTMGRSYPTYQPAAEAKTANSCHLRPATDRRNRLSRPALVEHVRWAREPCFPVSNRHLDLR